MTTINSEYPFGYCYAYLYIIKQLSANYGMSVVCGRCTRQKSLKMFALNTSIK